MPFLETPFSTSRSSAEPASATDQLKPPGQLLDSQQAASSVVQTQQQNLNNPLDQLIQYYTASSLAGHVQPFIHQQVIIEENLKDTDERSEYKNNIPFKSYDKNDDESDSKSLHDNVETTDSTQMESEMHKNRPIDELFGSPKESFSEKTDHLNTTVFDHPTEASVKENSTNENSIHELVLLSHRNELLKVPLTYEGSNDMVLLEEINWSPTLHSIPHDMFPPDKSSGNSFDVDDELKDDTNSEAIATKDTLEDTDFFKWKSEGKFSKNEESNIGRGSQSDSYLADSFYSHIGAEFNETVDGKPKPILNAEDERNSSTHVSYEASSRDDSHNTLTRKRAVSFPNHTPQRFPNDRGESTENSECFHRFKENAKVIADMLINKARNVMNKLEIKQ